MIVSFSVSNFRSFAAEETISFVASRRLLGQHEDHAVPVPGSDEKVLRTAVIYGANGAGKSNLFKALMYMEAVASRPRLRDEGTGREPFRLGTPLSEPTTMDLRFIVGGRLYRFGFNVDDRSVREEWLLEGSGDQERTIYERVANADGKVSINAQNAGEKIRALAKIGGPQNQSFLATVKATLDPSDIDPEVNEVLTWFRDGLVLVAPDSLLGSLGHVLAANPDLKTFASDFLKSSATGIERLLVDKAEIRPEDLSGIVPRYLLDQLYARRSGNDNAPLLLKHSDGRELLVETEGRDRYYLLSVLAEHSNGGAGAVTFGLAQESDGTRRLLNLIPALHDLKRKDRAYFIDEIDRSMHPILVRSCLESFLTSQSDGATQLIVTTHDTNLLDLSLIRRDEIWFAEKDGAGATRLYSLADFEVRKNSSIREHYLQGRFGAIPFLGDFSRLREQEPQPK